MKNETLYNELKGRALETTKNLRATIEDSVDAVRVQHGKDVAHRFHVAIQNVISYMALKNYAEQYAKSILGDMEDLDAKNEEAALANFAKMMPNLESMIRFSKFESLMQDCFVGLLHETFIDENECDLLMPILKKVTDLVMKETDKLQSSKA
jgi:hypothetical protein